jgi:hypothetical protein
VYHPDKKRYVRLEFSTAVPGPDPHLVAVTSSEHRVGLYDLRTERVQWVRFPIDGPRVMQPRIDWTADGRLFIPLYSADRVGEFAGRVGFALIDPKSPKPQPAHMVDAPAVRTKLDNGTSLLHPPMFALGHGRRETVLCTADATTTAGDRTATAWFLQRYDFHGDSLGRIRVPGCTSGARSWSPNGRLVWLDPFASFSPSAGAPRIRIVDAKTGAVVAELKYGDNVWWADDQTLLVMNYRSDRVRPGSTRFSLVSLNGSERSTTVVPIDVAGEATISAR